MKVDHNMMIGFYKGFFSAFKLFFASSVFPFVVLFIILSIIWQWKRPVIKGWYGEWVVRKRLKRLPTNYTVFHDLYIPNGDRGLTQVDHIVTSENGLFVIETKHYNGWIFGDEFKPYWTQVIYKKKTKMYNPIRQNYGHVQALAKYIGKDDSSDIHSIIAFSPNSTFKFKHDFKTAQVIQFPKLLATILKDNERQFSTTELQDINDKIATLVVRDKQDLKRLKIEHKKTVHEAKKGGQPRRVEQPIQVMTSPPPISIVNAKACPTCDSALTLKNGRFGKFYGCSSFPKCRFTEKV